MFVTPWLILFVCLVVFFFGMCTPPGAFEINGLCKIWGKQSFIGESKIEYE